MNESTCASSEMIAFGLVAQAGDARSKAFGALRAKELISELIELHHAIGAQQ